MAARRIVEDNRRSSQIASHVFSGPPGHHTSHLEGVASQGPSQETLRLQFIARFLGIIIEHLDGIEGKIVQVFPYQAQFF